MPYDIHIELLPYDKQQGTKFYTFGFKRTVGVRGIQKLVNMFAKYLLTPVGTDPVDLDEGTDIPGLLGTNIAPLDARDVVVLAIQKTANAIRTFQTNRDVPNDERLLQATLTDFLIIPTNPGFAAQILIENVSGEGLKIILPTLEVRT